MKKLFMISLALTCACLLTNAQINNKLTVMNDRTLKNYFNDPEISKSDYLAKSRNQKIAAFVLLGGGAIAVVCGVIVESNNAEQNSASLIFDEGSTNSTGIVIAVAGACMMGVSIPLFISSSKNKRKAQVAISNQKTGFGVPSNVSKNITGVSLKIPIN